MTWVAQYRAVLQVRYIALCLQLFDQRPMFCVMDDKACSSSMSAA